MSMTAASQTLRSVADTLVFRAAMDLMAEAVLSHKSRQFVVLPAEPFIEDMIRTRLSESCLELAAPRLDSNDYVAVNAFGQMKWEEVAGHPSSIHISMNPMVRWPWRSPSSLRKSDPLALARRARKEGYSVETAGSGTPLYFALDVLSRTVGKSTALHFFIKDVAQRSVESKGYLAASGAIIVLWVEKP